MIDISGGFLSSLNQTTTGLLSYPPFPNSFSKLNMRYILLLLLPLLAHAQPKCIHVPIAGCTKVPVRSLTNPQRHVQISPAFSLVPSEANYLKQCEEVTTCSTASTYGPPRCDTPQICKNGRCVSSNTFILKHLGRGKHL